jgi:hypothetical protein
LSSVTNAELAANAVQAGNIAANAVTEGKIAANAVVADKIAANAIVADKIATNAITAGKIAAGAVTADKITVSELSALNATIGGWSITTTGITKTTDGQGTITLDSSGNRIVLSDTSATRFEVNTSNNLTLPTTSTDRKTLVSNAGFLVARDDERYFRHITEGSTPLGGKAFVFNDTKGGFRTDILTFHTPVLSEDYLKFPTSSANLDNDSLLPYALSGGVPNASFPVWMPRTSEVIMYDRPGDPVGGYQAGSQPYNSGGLQSGGGTAIGGTTFRVHTGAPETDSTFGGVTLPLRFRIDTTGNIQILKDLQVYGNITAFYTSDKRLKENINPIPNSLEKVNKLNGVEFDWKKGFEDIHTLNGHDIGLLAQEVEDVLPEIVSTRHDGYKAIQYDKVVALLVESVKELSNKVTELENKITELENKK